MLLQSSTGVIRVTPAVHSPHEGLEQLRASIHVRNTAYDVWFRAPGPIAATAEPFWDLTLPVAMRLGLPIRCATPINDKLRNNAANLQARFAAYDKSLSPVEMMYDDLSPAMAADPVVTGPRGVGVFFSGGVDSFDTLLTHLDTITHLVFVHGFDIPINNTSARDIALASAKDVAQSLNKGLIVVETNLRTFGDPFVQWGHHLFGAAAAAVCHLLSPQLKAIYLAGEEIDPGAPVGSRPDLDPLWATESATLIHHGEDRSRFKKLQGLADHPLARRHLRVCWHNAAGLRNCGGCSKCMRNMAALRAMGVLDQFTSFEKPLDLNKLSCLGLPSDWHHVRRGVQEIMTHAQSHGRDPELVSALEDCLKGRYHGGWINNLRWRYWRLMERLHRVSPQRLFHKAFAWDQPRRMTRTSMHASRR